MAPPPTLQELIETVRLDAGSDQPLDQLVTAASAAAQLGETTDALLGHFVDRCRRDGRSWSEISNALGVTKQAVHKRFAPALAAHIFAATPSPTFERFTDRARHVAAASRQAAQSVGAGAVGAEHLLLALFVEPAGIAGRALAEMNVSEESVHAAILAARGPGQAHVGASAGHDEPADSDPAGAAGAAGSGTAAAAGAAGAGAAGTAGTADIAGAAGAGSEDATAAGPSLAFAEDAKRALGDALTVALEFSHNYVGTEHLLLGLYRNPGSTAAGILIDGGALEATARAHVTDMLRRLQ